MADDKKLNYGLIITATVTILGWGITFGTCQQQIKQNEKDIIRLEKAHAYDISKVNDRQNNTDNLLQSINTQLVELNTKMSLLLNGKINAEEKK